ncbi:MAG: DUF6178 family protein [Desulfobacterales bacterium]|nr:DUF6178 family protein [Desulfobacterales bacterium]
MTPPTADDKILALRRELTAQRRRILDRPPEEALARVLAHPQPAALAHSFPEEDFFFLIQDIGPDDAHPLIALGSGRQLEYLLDQQVWNRDRLDLRELFFWLERFVAADPARMVRWLAREKNDLVEYYLFNTIEIRLRENDQDPTDFGPEFTSFDNFFYFRVVDLPSAEPLGEEWQKKHRRLVRGILERLAEDDHVHYQRVLLSALNVLPAETEEEAYRLRNVRLAEKGFLPFEEAVGLYQPINYERFQQTAARFQVPPADELMPLPMVPLDLAAGDQLFQQALQAVAPGEILERIQSEFAALGNRLCVADRLKPDNRKDLNAVLQKACGYLSIGLERVNPDPPLVANAARTLQAFNLEGLFRLGFSQAAELKQTTEAWVSTSWFARGGLPLTFWGEDGLGLLGGLLLKRPLYFDRGGSGHRYREFMRLDDIQTSERRLAQIQALDGLLDKMSLELPLPRRYGHLTYKNVLLTLWARSELGLPETLRPIALDPFRDFWEGLFEAQPVGAEGRSIADESRTACLQWLARRTARGDVDLAETVGPQLTALFAELEDDYGRISGDRIDPRFVHHFLLQPEPTAADGQ